MKNTPILYGPSHMWFHPLLDHGFWMVSQLTRLRSLGICWPWKVLVGYLGFAALGQCKNFVPFKIHPSHYTGWLVNIPIYSYYGLLG
jgi:hypothetical protein